jgi:hypothetical protein
MICIGVGVEEDHRQSFGAFDSPRKPFQLGPVQGLDLFSGGSRSSCDSQTVSSGDQRRGTMSHEGIELGSILAPDLQNVFETPVGDEDHPGSLSFQ